MTKYIGRFGKKNAQVALNLPDDDPELAKISLLEPVADATIGLAGVVDSLYDNNVLSRMYFKRGKQYFTTPEVKSEFMRGREYGDRKTRALVRNFASQVIPIPPEDATKLMGGDIRRFLFDGEIKRVSDLVISDSDLLSKADVGLVSTAILYRANLETRDDRARKTYAIMEDFFDNKYN